VRVGFVAVAVAVNDQVNDHDHDHDNEPRFFVASGEGVA